MIKMEETDRNILIDTKVLTLDAQSASHAYSKSGFESGYSDETFIGEKYALLFKNTSLESDLTVQLCILNNSELYPLNDASITVTKNSKLSTIVDGSIFGGEGFGIIATNTDAITTEASLNNIIYKV